MGLASTGRGVVLAAIALAGCSYTYTPKQTTGRVSSNAQCGTNTRAVADSVIGAGSIGLGAGVGFLALDGEESLTPIVASVGLVAVGIVYLASANHGFSRYRSCNEELLARAHEPGPLHVINAVPANRTCQQRRLDMYSQAVTGADPDQRTELLRTLPACAPHISATADERARLTTHERAWALTKTAALDAGAGKCDEIESIARELFDLDVSMHDVVFLADIEIKHCLLQREI